MIWWWRCARSSGALGPLRPYPLGLAGKRGKGLEEGVLEKGVKGSPQAQFPLCGDVLCEPACDGLVPGLVSKPFPDELHCTAAQPVLVPFRVPECWVPCGSFRRATAKPSGNA